MGRTLTRASMARVPATPQAAPPVLPAWTRYWADVAWRSVATLDALRQRAENMLDHEAAGMPPLLHFESEEIADAHAFDPPCNYRLLRITRCGTDHLEQHVRRDAAPVIVVDPRAGHGPGIGGFKRDSEVGMSFLEGHRRASSACAASPSCSTASMPPGFPQRCGRSPRRQAICCWSGCTRCERAG